jgi:hypothetical protein
MALNFLQQLRLYRSLPLNRATIIAALAVFWPVVYSAAFALVLTFLHPLCCGETFSPLTWIVSAVSALAACGLVYRLLDSSHPCRVGTLRFERFRRV